MSINILSYFVMTMIIIIIIIIIIIRGFKDTV